MDEQIPTFLAVTGVEDEAVAKQFLEITGGNLDMAVTLYMESGQQGNTGNASGTSGVLHNLDDEAYAKQLQEQAYGASAQDNVREADANVHRHETLMDSFGPGPSMFGQMQRQADLFGQRQQGIFHQGFDFTNRASRSINSYNAYDDDIDDEDPEEEEDEEEGEGEEEEGEDYEFNYGNGNVNGGIDYEDAEYGHQNRGNHHDIQILDSDDDDDDSDNQENIIRPTRTVGRRRRLRNQRDSNLTSVQRRLANLFRPPFDIISVLTIDQARAVAKTENKWILVNIQDSSEFQSQVLNRDFWSNARIKQIVKDEFIFLQYQKDSFDGESYVNFYHVEQMPHIAILDPLTGERVYKWKEGEVPQVENWISDVDQFLTEFSLAPGSSNPIVKHERKIDPDSLTEEQQIELAMKQSVMDNNANNGTTIDKAISLDSDSDIDSINDNDAREEERDDDYDDDDDDGDDNDNYNDGEKSNTRGFQENDDLAKKSTPLKPLDPFDAIVPQNHSEPAEGAITRVQIRFPNGKRLVRKLAMHDKVVVLFEWLKYVLQDSAEEYGLDIGQGNRFVLSNSSNKAFKFIENLQATIEDANLKNASILLEKD